MMNSGFNALSCFVEAKASDLLQSLGRVSERASERESSQNSSWRSYPGNLTKLSERRGEERSGGLLVTQVN